MNNVYILETAMKIVMLEGFKTFDEYIEKLIFVYTCLERNDYYVMKNGLKYYTSGIAISSI